MKKYLLLGLAVVVLGVLGARVWLANSADDRDEAITPEQLSGWVQNPDNAVSETRDDYFYIQEAIGSTGVTMECPQEIAGSFALRFRMMSLTRAADIRFRLHRDKDVYDVEMKIGAAQSKVRLLKNRLMVLEKDGVIIRPDTYYTFDLRKKDRHMAFGIDGQDILKMEIGNAPLKFMLELTGEPDNPAAVQIKDLQIMR